MKRKGWTRGGTPPVAALCEAPLAEKGGMLSHDTTIWVCQWRNGNLEFAPIALAVLSSCSFFLEEGLGYEFCNDEPLNGNDDSVPIQPPGMQK